ncbi:MAG: hypothetical protein ACRDJ9_35140 [Dehalococcoidia bacterium]
MFFLQVRGQQGVYVSDGMNTRHVPAGQWDLTCKPLIAAGVPFLIYPHEASLLDAGGPQVKDSTPITDAQLAELAEQIAARLPQAPTAPQIADLLSARLAA